VNNNDAVDAALATLRSHCPGFRPRVGLVLGSGLGALADRVAPLATLPYRDIPGFPVSGVHGHAGKLILGRLAGQDVACFAGRVHYYEGHGPATMAVPIRCLKALGADILVLTNAAGSLRPDLLPGRLMRISDHINLTGANPLIGTNDDRWGPRFPGLSGLYDPDLGAQLHHAARMASIDLAQGVYVAVSGPNFETPAEIRAFAVLGGDAVGMSTVHEAILARHCGLRVAAVSAITNLGEGLGDVPLSHDQTLQAGAEAAGSMIPLLTGFLERLADDPT